MPKMSMFKGTFIHKAAAMLKGALLLDIAS